MSSSPVGSTFTVAVPSALCVSCSVVADSLQPYGLRLVRFLCPWDSFGGNTGVGCHSLLQEIFPNPGIEPGSPYGRWILYRLCHQGSHLLCPFSNHASCWSRQHKGFQPGLPTAWSFPHSTLSLLHCMEVSSSRSRFISDHVTSTVKPKAALGPGPCLD